MRGTTISMVPISNQAGVLVGPVLGGLTLAIWDYEGLGILCFIIGLIGVLISITRLKENKIQLFKENISLKFQPKFLLSKLQLH